MKKVSIIIPVYKVEMYISQCSAFQGLTLIGMLFTNQCSVNADQLYNFLMTMLPISNVDQGVLDLLSVLRYTGIYNVLTMFVNIIGQLHHCAIVKNIKALHLRDFKK